MPFYQGGGRYGRSPMGNYHSGPTRMSLLSGELWPVPQFVSGEGGASRRKAPAQDEPDVAATSDDPTGLPASVVNMYREKLDREGQEYLARGPRTFDEQLAYAQQVRPEAHEDSTPASAEDQLRFRQWRDVDWANNFVGPDGIVYVRDHWMGEEKPEARIFRAYENTVGGFKRPKLDDLLNQFDLPDRLEGYSPETKAKIADVESFDRPLSADQAAWQAWAREQGVNPATWFKGDRLPDFDQTDYQLGDNRDVPPVVSGSTFVGPDGIFYQHTDQTRPDRSTRIGQALEHQRAMDALRDAPPPSSEELYDRFLSSGGLFPGSKLGRGYQPWRTPTRQEMLDILKRPGGGRGSSDTRDDLKQQLDILLLRNPSAKHIHGSQNQLGRELPEEYVPNPAGTLLGNGHEKSIWPDATLTTLAGLRRYIWRLEQATMTRSGKPTLDEDAKALQLFLRTQSNGYEGVPRSNVYVLTKRNQLKELLDNYRAKEEARRETLDRQQRSTQRRREEDDDNRR